MEKSKFVDFEVSDYGEFYNYMFGGFDECNSDDDESLNTEEEDEDYIKEETDESEIEEYEDEDDENDELGEDLNKY